MARTRQSFCIRRVNITQVNFKNNVPTALSYDLPTVSENRAFRMFSETQPHQEAERPGILVAWVQVDFQPARIVDSSAMAEFGTVTYDESRCQFLVEAILREGLMVDGQLYIRCLRSASQVRSGEALFVRADLDRDAVRKATSFGAIFGKRNAKSDGSLIVPTLPAEAVVENIAKMEARYGLATSSSLDTGLVLGEDLTYQIRPDFERTISTKVYRKGSTEITITPTDGMGFIRPAAAVKVAVSLEIISEKQGVWMLHNLHTVGYCDLMLHDVAFRAEWLKSMPSAFQIRCAGVKGLQVVYPFDELHGVDCDVVILDSQWKYTYEEGQRPTLEVCAWQKAPKSTFVRLNYQFIQALSLTGADLIGLAQSALSRLQSTVLSDPNDAMAFLGMIASANDDDGYGATLVSTLTRTLNACPAMLSDFQIQKSIRKLLKKYVTEMRHGRIPVEGEYRYIIGDPSVAFWKEQGYSSPEACPGILAPGQNYMGGICDTYAAFRSPQISNSESCLLTTCDVPMWTELGLFGGLSVLNTHDDTLPRAGGADCDGDKMLFTPHPVIVANVVSSDMLDTEAREGTYSQIDADQFWPNMLKYDLSTASGSLVGLITNLATTKVDRALCEVERQRSTLDVMVIDAVAVCTDEVAAEEDAPLDDNCPF